MTQRSILITGCSSGIGLASARAMHQLGWRVFATARTPKDLERLNGNEGVEAVHLDLADPQSIAACADSVLAATGGTIDALFNNAAYGQPGALEDVSVEALRAQFEVNVFGTHDLTRRLIPAMLGQGHGRIVQCSSVLGILAAPYRGAYCASKFALEAISDVMRMELAGTGVDVSIIEPGPINTRFIDSTVAAAHRWIDIDGSRHRARYEAMLKALGNGGKQTFKLEPEAVAAKLVHAVESPRPKAHYYVTWPTYMAVVARRTLPIKVIDWIASKN
ncbi:MAG: NAD(P)-dependent dehydrogenase (short-subunit alcohol dehydrogenase family) [Hyphomicrobiaceae bacterium]|jgi:NAD(P)-dependent dehydrogenase (short-subunit alcohol dehydrogenase family)